MQKNKCGRKPKDGTKISVILDNSLLKKIKTFQEKIGLSKTEIIEDAIKDYLDKNMESEDKVNGK